MGKLRLRRRVERAFNRLGLASGILMYHRVARETHDPWDLCVTPEHFAEQMEVLRRVVSCEALKPFVDRRWRPRGRQARIAVTFDDGYRDNLTQALPILERYEIPATVFVVSGTVGSSREFWWDTIERCVLSPHKLPDVLELSVGGASQRWRLDDDDRADMAPDGWHADLQEPSTVRQRLFLDVWRSLVHCEPRERDAVIDGLMAWAGVGRAPQSRLPLSRPELAELAAHPLITIGCHTVSHAALPDLPPDQQRREIETCRCALEDWTARKVATFAYPYGRYDDVTAAVVRDLGYAAVCTTEPWPVTPLSRRWELPRLQVTDVDGEGFERWLRPHLRSDSRALSA